jgi:cellulose synthase/poly-beta-1,6-N-acetylglucosamine synthase-like glycosyltransferase
MTLGIAIPTYSGHLYNLENLLNQISKSTVLPSQVSVSISSFDGDLTLENYPFELIITKTAAHRNTAQNINIAADKLSTDIITLMGGDDIPHIKRNEYIMKAFDSGAKVVLHNYTNAGKDAKEYVDDIGEIQLFIDYIDVTPIGGPIYPTSSVGGHICYANGPISLYKYIFKEFKYGEGPEFLGMEDSIYNSNLVIKGYKISYIQNSIMLYIH